MKYPLDRSVGRRLPVWARNLERDAVTPGEVEFRSGWSNALRPAIHMALVRHRGWDCLGRLEASAPLFAALAEQAEVPSEAASRNASRRPTRCVLSVATMGP